MDIKYSRRILCIGAPGSRVLDVIKDLTGSAPDRNEAGTTAGLSHEWGVKTAYYSAKVPIWIDEIVDTDEWKQQFLEPEAQEVVQAVGAWIYCFDKEEKKEAEDVMRAIAEVAAEHGGDALMLAVRMQQTPAGQDETEEWDGMAMDHGFEFVDYGAKDTNEFGEKVGFERMKEALEANYWSALDDEDEGSLGLEELDIGDMGFADREEAEWTSEFFGVKATLAGDDEEEDEQQATQVDNLDQIMGKLLAVKEQSADLPEVQRKRMAAKAVKDLMGT